MVMKKISKFDELPEEAKEYFNDLSKNFDKHVERYRKEKERELKEGKREKILEELDQLDFYLEGAQGICRCGDPKCQHTCYHPLCKKSFAIPASTIEIEFCNAKIEVLKKVLGK